MAKMNLFLETKIGLVMKLRKLSRAAAVAELARMGATLRTEKRQTRMAQRRGVCPSNALVPQEEHEFMSAEEFFKDV